MSASTAPSAEARARARGAVDDDRGSGWLAFAGTMLAILGTMNVIYGIAAIDDSNVFVGDARFVFSDLNTWGWILVCAGALQVVGAFGIWSGSTWGKWIGILSAGVNAILQLLWLPGFPFLALSLFAVDVLVLYGLFAYGGRRPAV